MTKQKLSSMKHTFDRLMIAAALGMVVALYGANLLLPTDMFYATYGASSMAQKSKLVMAEYHSTQTASVAKKIHYKHTKEMSELMNRPEIAARLQDGRIDVPRIFPASLPDELGYITHIKTKQALFVETLLPHILKYNDQVLADRATLKSLHSIKASGGTLRPEQRQWLTDLARKYKAPRVSIDDLLKRVDIIPPSLALAQAVVESGWGISGPARSHNSPFGMMRDSQRLMVYNTLHDGVRSYAHNLNTHPAYVPMRAIRAKLREKGHDLCGAKLAEGLVRYSELGHAYTLKVKKVISAHNFKKYDRARLSQAVTY